MQRRLFALFLIVLAAGCGRKSAQSASSAPAVKEEPGVPAVDEIEPNNDSKSAQHVDGSATIHASFVDGPKPDEDWFRVASPGPINLHAEVNSATALDFDLTVFDGDKNKLMHLTGAQTLIVPGIMCKPVCFVRVAAPKKETGDYTLTLLMRPPGPRDEREPNNRYVDAQELPFPGAVDGYLFPADDQDWYKITPSVLAPNQVISVTLTPPADVWPELVVARVSDQAPMATYRAAQMGEVISIRDLGAPHGAETGYYLVVRSAWVAKGTRSSNAKAAYTLEVKAADGTADLEVEPNNDAVHATPVELTALKRTGYISPKGDVDWYTFTTTGPSIVHAEVTGLDKVRLILSVIDPTKKDEDKHSELAKSEASDVREPVALSGIAVPAGVNYVKVEGAYKQIDGKWVHDYQNLNDPYTLTMTVDPDDGSWEREPNNDPDKATPVEIGKTYKGFIQPARDVDFYKVIVKDATNVAITVSAVPKLDLRIKVMDASRKDAKGENALVGSSPDKERVETEQRLVIPFEPGTYFIEISDKAHESNALKPYVLSLK